MDTHSVGHYGLAKTLDRAMRSFTGLICLQTLPNIVPNVRLASHGVLLCPDRKRHSFISPDRPFQIVAADITELPISTKCNRYVLVMMALYTKFVNLYPLKDQTSCLSGRLHL